MSNTTPVRMVIVGCGMISAGGYQAALPSVSASY